MGRRHLAPIERSLSETTAAGRAGAREELPGSGSIASKQLSSHGPGP